MPLDSAGSFGISQFGMQRYLENVCLHRSAAFEFVLIVILEIGQ